MNLKVLSWKKGTILEKGDTGKRGHWKKGTGKRGQIYFSKEKGDRFKYRKRGLSTEKGGQIYFIE